LCIELTKAEKRKRKRKQAAQANYEAAIKAIVLDLYRAHLSDRTLEVGIGKRQETLQKRSTWQYGSTIYTPTQFVKAIEGLLQGGFINKTTNFRTDRIGGHSRTSRYKATHTENASGILHHVAAGLFGCRWADWPVLLGSSF
jgi:hypothetical protein